MRNHHSLLLARFWRDEAAAAAAEFALVVPVFLALIFGTINGSIMMSAVTQMNYAAERAARCMSVDVDENCPAGEIDAYAKGFYNGPALTGLTFSSPGAEDCGSRVNGAGTYQLLSGIEATTVNISSTACYPLI